MLEKHKDLIKTIILSASIVVAALILAFSIKEGTHYIGDAIGNGLSFIGINSSAAVTAGAFEFGEFMSENEATAFLGVASYDFYSFIEQGKLDGTFTKIESSYVFSKEKLTQWFENRIE